MWDHLSHARVLKLEKIVSMHNASSNIYIYIYIYIYHRLEEITPLVTGVKNYIYKYHRLGEIMPVVTGVKSYI